MWVCFFNVSSLLIVTAKVQYELQNVAGMTNIVDLLSSSSWDTSTDLEFFTAEGNPHSVDSCYSRESIQPLIDKETKELMEQIKNLEKELEETKALLLAEKKKTNH